MDLGWINHLAHIFQSIFQTTNNDYPNFSFLGFLKKYSIVGIFLKEKFVIKNKMSDESLLGFYSLLP